MKNNVWLTVSTILKIIVVFCGCEEQNSSNNQKNFENITLESRVVELAEASLDFIKDGNIIKRVDQVKDIIFDSPGLKNECFSSEKPSSSVKLTTNSSDLLFPALCKVILIKYVLPNILL